MSKELGRITCNLLREHEPVFTDYTGSRFLCSCGRCGAAYNPLLSYVRVGSSENLLHPQT